MEYKQDKFHSVVSSLYIICEEISMGIVEGLIIRVCACSLIMSKKLGRLSQGIYSDIKDNTC